MIPACNNVLKNNPGEVLESALYKIGRNLNEQVFFRRKKTWIYPCFRT